MARHRESPILYQKKFIEFHTEIVWARILSEGKDMRVLNTSSFEKSPIRPTLSNGESLFRSSGRACIRKSWERELKLVQRASK